jgi:uncharacterized protein
MAAALPCAELVLDDLREGSNELVFAIDSGALELKHDFFSFPGEVKAVVAVRRSVGNFALDGRIECRIAGECYRCLERMEESLQTTFSLLLQRREASADELTAAEDDGFIEIVDPGMRRIDMAEYLKEAIVLELPMRIPSEVSGGRCPHCGTGEAAVGHESEKTSDPRWDALKSIEFSQK